jgi:hypothetical protein
MYRRDKTVSSSFEEIVNYVEGTDIYNSLLLELIKDPSLPRETYEVKTYEYRPDLIAREVYGSTGYEGLLMLQAGATLTNFQKGVTLMLIPKTNLDSLIRSI